MFPSILTFGQLKVFRIQTCFHVGASPLGGGAKPGLRETVPASQSAYNKSTSSSVYVPETNADVLEWAVLSFKTARSSRLWGPFLSLSAYK